MRHAPRSVTLPVLMLFLTSLLTACGFHLRGQINTENGLKTLGLSGQTSLFSRSLNRTLQSNGIEISDSAPYQVHIVAVEDLSQQDSVASAGNYEHSVRLSVTYQWQTLSGLPLFQPITLTRERHMTFNENTTNASDSEKAVVLRELQQELIAAMTRRITSLSEPDLDAAAQKARALEQARQKQQQSLDKSSQQP